MFRLFRPEKDRGSFNEEQAVIVEIDLAEVEGSENDEIQELRLLESSIEGVLPEKAEFDGDEIGEGQAILYIYGKSAEIIFKSIEPILKSSIFNYINITLRYGAADDPKVKERKFTL